MNKSKVVLLIVGVLVLCGGLFAGLLLVKQNQDLAERAAPATVLNISPDTQSKALGSTFSVSVYMDTSVNAVTGVDIRLNFDPSNLEVTSLAQGSDISSLNQTISNTYDNATGKIQYAVFTLNSSQAVIGSNIEVLKVNGRVKPQASSGSTTISFDASTAASGSQEGQNVITSMSSATLNITEGVGSPTNAPTAVPTSTPTNNPTVAPTHTASPTQAASTAGIPTPRPTATSMPIPVSGSSWATYVGAALGIFVVIGSLLLAL